MASTDIHLSAKKKDQPKKDDKDQRWRTKCGLPGEERYVADDEQQAKEWAELPSMSSTVCATCLGKPEPKPDETPEEERARELAEDAEDDVEQPDPDGE